MPFTAEQFLQVFASYNRAIWPLQIPLAGAGIGLALLGLFRPRWSGRAIAVGLAALWAWMGVIYHWGFFRHINPAAVVFGAAFLLQSLLFLRWGLKERAEDTGTLHGPQAWVGGVILGYALLLYPLLGWMLGHRYPESPTFGLPCPTTIATLGLLVWAPRRPPWWLLVVPLCWVVVGTTAAFALGMAEDLGLLGAGVTAAAWLFSRAAHESTSSLHFRESLSRANEMARHPHPRTTR